MAVVPQRRWFHTLVSFVFITWGGIAFANNLPFFLHLNLAKVAREYGKFDVALDLFNIALADTAAFHHPESRKVRVLSSIAELQFDECRYEESVETYLYVLRLQQSIKTSVIDQAETMLHLGSALRKCGQYKQAQIVLEEALRLNSARANEKRQRAELNLALGQVLLAIGQEKDALGYFSSACRFFLAEKQRGASYARAGLIGEEECRKRLGQVPQSEELEKQLEKLKVPLPQYSWLEYERFCYQITDMVLNSSTEALLHPDSDLCRLVAPSALAEIERHAIKLGATSSVPEPTALSTVSPHSNRNSKDVGNHVQIRASKGASEVDDFHPSRTGGSGALVNYVEITLPDKLGLLDASVMASRTNADGKVSRFYLRYKLGFGLRTGEPILAYFGMLGERNQIQPTQGNLHGPNVSQANDRAAGVRTLNPR